MKLKFSSLFFFLLTFFFGFLIPAHAFAVGHMDIANVYVRNDHIEFDASNFSITPNSGGWNNVRVLCPAVTGPDIIYTKGHISYSLTHPYVLSSDYAISYNNGTYSNCGIITNDGTNNFLSNQTFNIPTPLPSPTPTNAQPTIGSLPNSTILLENTVIGTDGKYIANSSFTDPDSTSWSATVDYGDGSGTQPLILNPDKTFSLSHQYISVGTYTITVVITDDQNSTGVGTGTATLVAPRTFDAANIYVRDDHIGFDASGFSTQPNLNKFGNVYINCLGVGLPVVYTQGHGEYFLPHIDVPSSDYAFAYDNSSHSNCYITAHDGTNNFYSNQSFSIPLAATPTLVTAINAGDSTQGSFVADTDYTGGTQYSSSASVDTSGVNNAAPEAVYKSVRYGNFTYTLPNLTQNASYTVRLHFNELYWNSAGSRVFNVSINGTQVLSNYDIYDAAGGANKAIVEQLPATADSNGNITLQFSTVVDNAMVNGIELYSGTLPSPTPTPTPTPVTSLSINSGGNATGSFVNDTDYTGGTQYTSSASVDTSGVTNPAPESVYQSVRYGNFTYTIPHLIPNTAYHVRLNFNELYWGTLLTGGFGGVGSRVFNVTINGDEVLHNYDIFAAAGGANKAVVEEFTQTTDANGKLTIQFSTVTDNAMVNGIEVFQ